MKGSKQMSVSAAGAEFVNPYDEPQENPMNEITRDERNRVLALQLAVQSGLHASKTDPAEIVKSAEAFKAFLDEDAPTR